MAVRAVSKVLHGGAEMDLVQLGTHMQCLETAKKVQMQEKNFKMDKEQVRLRPLKNRFRHVVIVLCRVVRFGAACPDHNGVLAVVSVTSDIMSPSMESVTYVGMHAVRGRMHMSLRCSYYYSSAGDEVGAAGTGLLRAAAAPETRHSACQFLLAGRADVGEREADLCRTAVRVSRGTENACAADIGFFF